MSDQRYVAATAAKMLIGRKYFKRKFRIISMHTFKIKWSQESLKYFLSETREESWRLSPTCRVAWRGCSSSCSSWSRWLLCCEDCRGHQSSLCWRDWLLCLPPLLLPCTETLPRLLTLDPWMTCRENPPETWMVPWRDEESSEIASEACHTQKLFI